MLDKKRIVLQPEYMKQFNCIGQACEDSCCIGWTVEIDKETYLRYKKISNKDLKPIMEKTISRKHNTKCDAAYGRIKMDENYRCPMLDEKNLCKIHGCLGEEYLSQTCAIYPRYLKKVDGKLERSATMSCPEIVRLGLLDSNGIAFEHIEENASIRIKTPINLESDSNLYIDKPQKYFWDIRIFSISLLQNRIYSLSERLIILGIIYKKINELCLNNKVKEIPAMLERMGNIIATGSMKEELDRVPTRTNIQMSMAKSMTDYRMQAGVKSTRYIECLNETLSGLGYITGEREEIEFAKYDESYKKYLEPYLKEKEFILENYLVNEFFKELMPFGAFKTIWDSYIFLCLIFSMVKLHMIGMAGYHEGLNDDLVLKLIQSYSKVVLHNAPYIEGMIQLLKDNGYDSLAYMAILVKN